jgi:hypothetical protein
MNLTEAMCESMGWLMKVPWDRIQGGCVSETGDIHGQLNTCKYFRVYLTFIIVLNHHDLNIIAAYVKVSSYPAISLWTGSPSSIPRLIIRNFLRNL